MGTLKLYLWWFLNVSFSFKAKTVLTRNSSYKKFVANKCSNTFILFSIWCLRVYKCSVFFLHRNHSSFSNCPCWSASFIATMFATVVGKYGARCSQRTASNAIVVHCGKYIIYMFALRFMYMCVCAANLFIWFCIYKHFIECYSLSALKKKT